MCVDMDYIYTHTIAQRKRGNGLILEQFLYLAGIKLVLIHNR